MKVSIKLNSNFEKNLSKFENIRDFLKILTKLLGNTNSNLTIIR